MDELINIFSGLALKAARHAPGRIFSRAGGRFAIRVLPKAKVPTAPNPEPELGRVYGNVD